MPPQDDRTPSRERSGSDLGGPGEAWTTGSARAGSGVRSRAARKGATNLFSRIRHRLVLLSALAGAVSAALGVTATSTPARTVAAGDPQDLAVSNVNTPAGTLTALRSGVTYQASHFPLGLRVTPPDGSWSGAQWRTTTRGKPAFGWADLGQGPATAPPRGLVQLETAYGPTPSVTATIARLQRGGSHLPASNIGGIDIQSGVAGPPGRVPGSAVRRHRLGHLRPHLRSVLRDDGRGEPGGLLSPRKGRVVPARRAEREQQDRRAPLRQRRPSGGDGSRRSSRQRTGSSGRSPSMPDSTKGSTCAD